MPPVPDNRIKEEVTKVRYSILSVLVGLAVLASTAFGYQPGYERSVGLAQSLIDRAAVQGHTGIVPRHLLRGAFADEVFTVHDARTLEPAYRLVVVRSEAGRPVGLIALDAGADQWLWCSFNYDHAGFPPVSHREAGSRLRVRRHALGMAGELGEPMLIQGCDKHLYWRFEGEKESWLLDAVRADAPILSQQDAPYHSAVVPGALPEPEISSWQGSPDALSGPFEMLAADNPAAYAIPGIPYHFQITSWYCGPASLQMMMDYLGEEVGQHNIADVANDVFGSGCISTDMRRCGHFSGMSTAIQDPLLQGYTERQLGYASIDRNFLTNASQRLKNTVYAQYPVFTLTWFDGSHSSGHYRVVKGYDDSLDVFVIHDPWYYGGLCGPDVLIQQSFFVDNLWDYSGHWCLVVSPWLLTPDFPAAVSEGDTFAVDLKVLYPGPTRFSGSYPCSGGQATVSLSSGLTLAGGSPTIALPSLASGDSATVSWDVIATGPAGEWGMAFQAQGTITGSSASYPSYTDSIGGHTYETVTVGGGLLAGWDPEERLTTDDGSSQTCFPGARAMVVNDDGTVHLVWAETHDDTGEIYYRRCVSDSWEPEVRLTENAAYAHSPCIAEGPDGRLHVAWVDSRDGNYEIYYKYWESGSGWSGDERVTTYGEVDYNPCIAAGDSAVYLAWEQRQGGAYRVAAVMFSMRTGLGWSASMDVDGAAARDSYRPSLAYGPEGLLHIVYERQTANDPDEHEKVVHKSWDGSLWSGRTGLSTDLSFSRNPVVAVGPDSTIHVVWQDGENLGSDVFYCHNDGAVWQLAEHIVTGGTEVSTPSVSVGGNGDAHVVWVDHRHGDAEIYFMTKDESGWDDELRLTYAAGASLLPTVSANSSGKTCIIWTDLRHGNADLYFITRSESGVGGELAAGPIDARVHLSQPYPVPFAGRTHIAFTIAEPSQVLLEVFDVKGRLIKTIGDGRYGSGTHRFAWDGTSDSGDAVAPGVYFLRCLTPEAQRVERIVLVR
jgi:hypothetical protein